MAHSSKPKVMVALFDTWPLTDDVEAAVKESPAVFSRSSDRMLRAIALYTGYGRNLARPRATVLSPLIQGIPKLGRGTQPGFQLLGDLDRERLGHSRKVVRLCQKTTTSGINPTRRRVIFMKESEERAGQDKPAQCHTIEKSAGVRHSSWRLVCAISCLITVIPMFTVNLCSRPPIRGMCLVLYPVIAASHAVWASALWNVPDELYYRRVNTGN